MIQPSGDQQWVVFYGTGCLIGMASVNAKRDVLASSIAYRGNGIRCMSNPVVWRSGSKWHMLFNVLEPSGTDAVRFDIWSTSSASLTNWLLAGASPIVVVQGGKFCGALTPDVLPAGSAQYDIYFGLVTPGASGVCNDLTQSTSIARTRIPASMLLSVNASSGRERSGSGRGPANLPGRKMQVSGSLPGVLRKVMIVVPILAILTTLALTVALPESTLSADSATSLTSHPADHRPGRVFARRAG